MLLALLVSLSLGATDCRGDHPAPRPSRLQGVLHARRVAVRVQGEYGAAIWNFRQADKIRVTPEVAFLIWPSAAEKLNVDVAFATFYYRQYLKRAPNASDALDVAERVGTVLAQAEAEGRGLLEVLSPGAVDVAINKASFAEAPVAVFLAPGEYRSDGVVPLGRERRWSRKIRTGKTTPVAFEPMPSPLIDAAGAVTISSEGPSRPINKLRVTSVVLMVAGGHRHRRRRHSLHAHVAERSATLRCSMMPDPSNT